MKPTRMQLGLAVLLVGGTLGAVAISGLKAGAAGVTEEGLAPIACDITEPEKYYLSHFQSSLGKRMDVKDFDKIEVDLNADKEAELLLKLKSLCEKPDSPHCMTLVLQKLDAICYRVIGEFQGVATVTTESKRGYLVLSLPNGTKASFDPLVTEYRQAQVATKK